MSDEQKFELRKLELDIVRYQRCVSELKSDLRNIRSRHLIEYANSEIKRYEGYIERKEFKVYKIKKELGLIEEK